MKIKRQLHKRNSVIRAVGQNAFDFFQSEASSIVPYHRDAALGNPRRLPLVLNRNFAGIALTLEFPHSAIGCNLALRPNPIIPSALETSWFRRTFRERIHTNNQAIQPHLTVCFLRQSRTRHHWRKWKLRRAHAVFY
jgi:hypothetical protein